MMSISRRYAASPASTAALGPRDRGPAALAYGAMYATSRGWPPLIPPAVGRAGSLHSVLSLRRGQLGHVG